MLATNAPFSGADEGVMRVMMRVVALLLWLPDGEGRRRVNAPLLNNHPFDPLSLKQTTPLNGGGWCDVENGGDHEDGDMEMVMMMVVSVGRQWV
ncbi:hypothetical protein Tco_0846515 [Tanacetum coccineum]